jgi:hypothetical protein
VWNGARAATIAHPLREPLAAIMGVLRGVVPPADALRMIPFARRALSGPSDGPGPSGTTALARLTAAGISRGTIDHFFRPFFGGVFFDTSLSTDAGRLDFLLRMFAEGFAGVPAKGMGEIPRLMLAAAPSVRWRFDGRSAASTVSSSATPASSSSLSSSYGTRDDMAALLRERCRG